MTSSPTTARSVPSADELLARLDPEQRAVATALQGPVCVLAGAGTGKTRAITHRIAYGVHAGVLSPQHVLAVTFTARAAGEMRGRLRQLGVVGVQARTFHSAALRQLTYFWPRVVGGPVPQLVASKARLIAEAAGRARVPAAGALLRDLAGEVEWAKSTRVAPDDYVAAAARAGRTPVGDLAAAETARLYAAYEEVKRTRAQIDFEDVLLLTVATLEDRSDIAEQVRAQYRHLVVDEYQDVNPLQQALLDQWLGGREDLCVVGDAAQTIYSFTGASPEYLLGFRGRYPEAEVIRLVRDYRSTPQVVALANGVLRSARRHGSDRVSAAAVELVAQRPSGPQPTFSAYPDETAEAAGAAGRVAELLAAGTPASEIAVLFRINAQSEVFEEALAGAGIPYLLRGAERFFERPEVREALVLLRGAARAATGDDEADAQAGSRLADDVRAVLASAGWTALPPAGSGAVRDRWESLNALVGLAEELSATDPDAGLAEMVAELAERATAQHAPTVEGVTLASLHAAKGLEWDAVLLVGLVDGTLPISFAVTPAAVEEERRLLYVGVTRAREHVHLSWASARSPGGRASRQPSRFLDGLRPSDPAGRPLAAAAGRSGRRGRRGPLPTVCSGCGAPLVAAADRTRGRCADCPPAYDERVFERLRAWRLERAQRDSVPAYVVFTDATLEAVAARGPSTLAELATINGVGSVKLDRYGADVLALLRTGEPGTDSPGKEVASGS